MDDLLSEFLTETNESLEELDQQIVTLEQNPNDPELLSSIFRIMHTIKGTCGFLGLPRLETLAHAAENVLSNIREGKTEVTEHAISLILESIDQIKFLVAVLGEDGVEPEGDDDALKASLNALAAGEAPAGDAPLDDAAEETAVDVEEIATEEEPEEEPEEGAVAEAEPAEAVDDIPEEKPTIAAAKATKAAADQVKKVAEKAAPKEDTSKASIRVHLDLLEHLMNVVSELVLTRNQLLQISRNQQDSDLAVSLQRLSHVTTELQEGIMKTRMQPIGNAWNKLPRIIRDLAKELDKKIDLQMLGAETELDRQVLELIKDPLTHMVRNSADHGLEDTPGRIEVGKSETGVVKLEAFHEGGHIIIRISDDGRGLNMEKITAKIIDNGLATQEELETLSETQIQQFIFKPGFSTAAAVTSVSGRGVGMDVVRSNIEKVGGSVDLKSTEGKGSVFTIKIPLTLAIVSGLIVGVAEERFAIPQLSVIELVRVTKTSEHKIEYINNTPVLRLRNQLLPLLYLRDVLNLPKQEEDLSGKAKSLFIVVSQVGNNTFGMIVDKIYDTEEIVVKPVSPILKHISVFSGNTILGDGSVIMILDPNGVAAKIGDFSAADGGAMTRKEAVELELRNDDERISLLIFRANQSETPKAVPLALVSRLEEVDLAAVEYSNNQPLVQYRDSLMPLIQVDDAVLPEEGIKPVLVFTDGNRAMGVVVDKILDIIEESVNVNMASDQPGLIGSTIISGHATDLLDAHYYINRTFSDWFDANKRSNNTPQNVDDASKNILLVDDSSFFRNLLVPVLSASG